MVKHTLISLSLAAIGAASPLLAQDTVNLIFSHPNMAPGEEVFMYAVPEKMGYFADEGITVNMQAASGGAQAAQIVMSGEGDLSTTMAEAVLQLREQGADLTAIYELKRNNGFAVGIPAGSDISSLEDLVGKTIGVPVAGGGLAMIIDESFRKAGLEPTYTPVVIGSGAPAAAAIENGRVDAAVLWDAAFGVVENQGVEFKYLDLGVQDELAGMSLVASQDFITENRDLALAYCRAMTKGLVFTLANKEAAIDIMFDVFPTTKPAGISEEEAVPAQVNILDKWLASALKNLPEGHGTGEIDTARWTGTAEKYVAAGILSSDETEGAYDTSFFRECNDFDHEAIVTQADAYEG
ncbi:ABC transporter substrate-binding protein [Tropicimonas isoalkanivorans]|uniref:NitT/TauT family transport system substrate-binding protein n=1 Tax=Tropicimonas isoalkanivorans TaxID=441112 RepID=A0A1I1KQ79_9RHOB|nr:ABC transporter substrate-binding protein [Tropicimonas isoalkanivorans]SFC62996.1 NitT/TauT family transport system substrate-binding protein [Tropicimonas isoalkanivorans]